MPAHSHALDETVLVLGWFWAAAVALGVLIVLRAIRRYQQPRLGLLIVFSVLIGPAVLAMSLFPAVFATLDLWQQEILHAEFWKAEIASGVLPLRIASYLVTYHLIRALSRFVPHRRELIRAKKLRGLSEDEIVDFTAPNTPNEISLWKGGDLTLLAFFQFAFYLLCLAALWFCAIYGIQSVLTALASWALFFIVDDWAVMAEYAQKFSCLPLPTHLGKVVIVDTALVGVVPAALFSSGLEVFAILLGVAMLVCGLLIGMFIWRVSHFETKSA